ncbi:SH3 domain-containing protein [Parasutterella excrementihominis]|uniref:SH3 domain-containing protein n=1 Tax=Parasutterella excrementihominis TaxID=487175 RepID=UPI003AB1B22A
MSTFIFRKITDKRTDQKNGTAAHKVAVGESETEENVSNDVTENITDVPTEPDTTAGEPDTSRITGNKIKVTADTLNVRAQASEEAEVLGMADEDDVYTIISEQGEWIEIDYNGNNGRSPISSFR